MLYCTLRPQLVPGHPLPSPQDLMGKILIKNKKKHHHRPSSRGSVRRKEEVGEAAEQASPNNGESYSSAAFPSTSCLVGCAGLLSRVLLLIGLYYTVIIKKPR